MINKGNKDIKEIVNNIADILYDADYQEALVMIEEKNTMAVSGNVSSKTICEYILLLYNQLPSELKTMVLSNLMLRTPDLPEFLRKII